MDHLRNSGMLIPLQIPTNNGVNHGFLGGAEFCPSTICLLECHLGARTPSNQVVAVGVAT